MIKNEETLSVNKLSWGTKFSYGIGQMGDSIPFNLFYFYFLFFLTDIAGINPVFAGTISLIAVTWDALTDPFVGYITDHSKNKYGRRRPFMIGIVVPYAISFILLFTAVPFQSVVAKNIYYTVMAILYWTCYKIYVIPYYALGAEMTQDFNERNTIRTIASLFMYVGAWISSAWPMLIIGYLNAKGVDAQRSWRIAATFFAIIAAITMVVCWRLTRGKELDYKMDEEEEKTDNIIKTFIDVMKMKPFRNIAIAVTAFCIGYAVYSGITVYLMTYNMGLSEKMQATYWTCAQASGLIWLPMVNYAANKIDKKYAYIALMGLAVAGGFVFMITGFPSFLMLVIFTFLFEAGDMCFWTLIFSMTYDCSEVDEFRTGKRREGSIYSLQSFFQKIGSAIGLWLTGFLMNVIKYTPNAEQYSDSVLKGIQMLETLVPAVFLLISVLAITAYPITKKRFEALKHAIQLRKEGKDYTTEGFEKLI